MFADPKFSSLSPDFWALIKMVSEDLGYTTRARGGVDGVAKIFSPYEIAELCERSNTNISDEYIELASQYSVWRANALNDIIRPNLMDAETAKTTFDNLYHDIYQRKGFSAKLPMNKQSGQMKQVNYFTAIINIITEDVITQLINTPHPGFDDDPRGLVFVWDRNNRLVGGASRRFDGAYPSINNPKIIWEIKEYYYATTFGSRVADGVYETQLDGFEFQEIYNRTGIKVYHTLFIDAYRTWWVQGKSYLCRLMDALNAGLVDEVIVGKEVLTRWPQVLREQL